MGKTRSGPILIPNAYYGTVVRQYVSVAFIQCYSWAEISEYKKTSFLWSLSRLGMSHCQQASQKEHPKAGHHQTTAAHTKLSAKSSNMNTLIALILTASAAMGAAIIPSEGEKKIEQHRGTVTLVT